ncbi:MULTISPECIES: hypothetical protein [Methylobacterium]|uniref:hypothetical protein n=1 Tax=Methylobacterium TaxID=407 RepID=UPI00034B1531|nr:MULTISPECIES: hypothetical protein [Methylobacterium]MBN4098566.1 hypothetical protein [Methylobacterium sp. OT2]UIN38506.1 hypothetical protein LXM90_31660 [Methylobacterium oryzae]
MPDFDEHLAREFVQGLVQSAIVRGLDPAVRLQQFRTLQQAAMVMMPDPAAVRTSKQIVDAIDLILEELTAAKS